MLNTGRGEAKKLVARLQAEVEQKGYAIFDTTGCEEVTVAQVIDSLKKADLKVETFVAKKYKITK